MTQKFEIRIKINDEEELYSPFDEERLTLSDDVIDYIMKRYKEKKVGNKMIIHIISKKDVDINHLKKALAKYLAVEKLQLNREKKANSFKQMWMFVIGALFIAIGLYATSMLPMLLGEIVSTIGAFAMWEAASIWIVENPNNRIKQKWIDILMQTEVIVSKGDDNE